jgi:hypothetical protein
MPRPAIRPSSAALLGRQDGSRPVAVDLIIEPPKCFPLEDRCQGFISCVRIDRPMSVRFEKTDFIVVGHLHALATRRAVIVALLLNQAPIFSCVAAMWT